MNLVFSETITLYCDTAAHIDVTGDQNLLFEIRSPSETFW